MQNGKPIYTVDDFGTSLGANQLIFEAFQKKILTHASIMVNMPGSRQALQSVQKFKRIEFGLHLNLTEPFNLPLPVEAQMRKQIELLQKFVKPISFINSHHNIHFWPTILPIVVKMAKEYGIKKIRAPRNFVGPSVKPSLMRFASLFSRIDSNLRLSKAWLDLDWYDKPMPEGILRQLPADCEISCHPLVFQKHRKQSTLQWLIDHKKQFN